ncbi:MAG: exodeoxyribonuclease V subunit alpha [Desulfobacter sp.]|nr:MAG: exodeoxyribonuclease V subunit alpha [Desulfobacter sp.]
MADYFLSDLDMLHDQGVFSHLDYYFAKTMADIFKPVSPLAILSAALVSKALGQGHICLNLKLSAQLELGQGEAAQVCLPELDPWIEVLTHEKMVGKEPEVQTPKTGTVLDWVRRVPLILDRDNNLYLSKYYDFQYRLIRNLYARVSTNSFAKDKKDISDWVERFFPEKVPGTDGQKTAILKALTHRFLVISGGPGTGKTHITNIITAVLRQRAEQKKEPEPCIRCLAPTGKAAARLNQGITIHAALKPKPDGVGFIHNRENLLKADMVIIDEASMIDIALMTRLMEAIPLDCRVVLLGDKHQLSPVQAGAVFTDICEVESMAGFRVFLSHNFRSKGRSGIEKLARAVSQNDSTSLKQILCSQKYPDVVFENTKEISKGQTILEKHISQGYQDLSSAMTLDQALDRMDNFRVLCAHNLGDDGTLQINHLCEKILRPAMENDIKVPFFKRIVMVNQNDYHKGLFNGDTGIVWEESLKSLAGFKGTDQEIQKFRILDLPSHDPAFAVTIHKSQGSEFDTVLILIPEKISPVVTRQLLYTGITRARKKAVVMGRLDVILNAMDMPFESRSNVVAKLDRKLGNKEGSGF